MRGFFILQPVLFSLVPYVVMSYALHKMWISSPLPLKQLIDLCVFLVKLLSLFKKDILWQQMKK